MANVTFIPAKRQVGNNIKKAEKPKLRVAAYCRVSSSIADQLVSLEVQKAHYEEYISANQASCPEDISLKAKLAWKYFFENNAGWIAVKTDDGPWIVMDEGFDLNTSMVFP